MSLLFLNIILIEIMSIFLSELWLVYAENRKLSIILKFTTETVNVCGQIILYRHGRAFVHMNSQRLWQHSQYLHRHSFPKSPACVRAELMKFHQCLRIHWQLTASGEGNLVFLEDVVPERLLLLHWMILGYAVVGNTKWD